MMKDNVVIVNTARGGIVEEKYLIKALENKKIFGAALDVFEEEPPREDNRILKLKNTILSPHNAALTLECRKSMAVESAENIVYFLTKKNKLNLNNIVNRKIIGL